MSVDEGTAVVKQPLVDLTGRHVVITGGAGGVGQALADVFAAANARISLLDLAGADTKEVAARITDAGGSAGARDCDVSDPAQVTEAFAWAESAFGRPDILVNNAGINKRGPSLEITGAEWDHTFAVNLKGYFQCAQEFGRRLVDAGQPGSVVMVSSIGGVTSLGRGNFSYGVTKAGVNQLTRELAVVWGPHGIRVNAVAPCQIATEGLKELSQRPSEEGHLLNTFLRGIPLGRLVEPSEVAAAVAFLASGAASMITGVVLPVDGGNLALNAGGTIGD
ncbi:MAG TPA: SDR family NAD(P)-dependent oxidoreductase [Streptosporangiaceae bacterium]|nr:SDR family NAD(P)-dependent oxidoreductase [Streptosporangiaceae bacterium]